MYTSYFYMICFQKDKYCDSAHPKENVLAWSWRLQCLSKLLLTKTPAHMLLFPSPLPQLSTPPIKLRDWGVWPTGPGSMLCKGQHAGWLATLEIYFRCGLKWGEMVAFLTWKCMGTSFRLSPPVFLAGGRLSRGLLVSWCFLGQLQQ